MRKRSKAREYALQALYQLDVRREASAEAIAAFWQEHSPPADVKLFADRLVRGTREHLADIDPLITHHASNWSLGRMGVVDRNILRLGVFELLFLKDVPPKVTINEAVELAKRFGDTDTGKFINGILDAIHKSLEQQTGSARANGSEPAASSEPPPSE